MIRNSPADFFAELGEGLLPVVEESRPSEVVDDRIDLLALDRDGSAMLAKFKRGAHKLQLLQALSYAAMVADWNPARACSMAGADRRWLANSVPCRRRCLPSRKPPWLTARRRRPLSRNARPGPRRASRRCCPAGQCCGLRRTSAPRRCAG